MADWTSARLSRSMAITAVVAAVGFGISVLYWRLSLTNSASLASILGFLLTILTLTTVAVAATAVRKALSDLSQRLILGDVARAVSLAEELRRLCSHEDWEYALTQADALQSVLSRLIPSSALAQDERASVREGAQDVTLIIGVLRKINRGEPQKKDLITWQKLDALILKLAEAEGRLRDVGRETNHA